MVQEKQDHSITDLDGAEKHAEEPAVPLTALVTVIDDIQLAGPSHAQQGTTIVDATSLGALPKANHITDSLLTPIKFVASASVHSSEDIPDVVILSSGEEVSSG